MMTTKRVRGFTLFEILVSISIIAILTAIATISYSNAQKKGRDAKRIEDLKMIQNAAEVFYGSSSTYSYPTSYTAGSQWKDASGNIILQSFPKDPKGASYNNSGSGATGYCLCGTLDAQTGGNAKDQICGATSFVGDSSGKYFCIKNQQ